MVVEILRVALMPTSLVCWLAMGKSVLWEKLGSAGLGRVGLGWAGLGLTAPLAGAKLGWDDTGRENIQLWWGKITRLFSSCFCFFEFVCQVSDAYTYSLNMLFQRSLQCLGTVVSCCWGWRCSKKCCLTFDADE